MCLYCYHYSHSITAVFYKVNIRLCVPLYSSIQNKHALKTFTYVRERACWPRYIRKVPRTAASRNLSHYYFLLLLKLLKMFTITSLLYYANTFQCYLLSHRQTKSCTQSKCLCKTKLMSENQAIALLQSHSNGVTAMVNGISKITTKFYTL